MDGDNVTFTFNEDENRTGTYDVGGTRHHFTYDFNNPQSGDVRMLLDDQHVVIITIVSVSDTTLIIRKKEKGEQYTLNKLY